MEQTQDSTRLGAASIAALLIASACIAVISLGAAGAAQGLSHLTAGVLALALGWRLMRRQNGLAQLLVIPVVTLVGLMVGSITYDVVRWFALG